MRIVLEGFLDISQIRAATSEDNTAQQLVAELLGNLTPDIGNDFLQTTLDNLNELARLHLTILVDGVFHIVVDVVVFRKGRSILELHLLSVTLLHLQRGNILRDIVSTERNDGQMTQDILRIHAHRRRVST